VALQTTETTSSSVFWARASVLAGRRLEDLDAAPGRCASKERLDDPALNLMSEIDIDFDRKLGVAQ